MTDMLHILIMRLFLWPPPSNPHTVDYPNICGLCFAIRGVARAVKVEGINENSLATPSSSLKICHYPLSIPV